MVEAVVSFAVERLHNLPTEEARLLTGVSDKAKSMQNELKRMQCFLRDAERKKDKNDTIKNYISEVGKLAYDAEDVIEIYAIKVALGISVGTKNPLAKTKHLHKVDDLTRNLQTYGLTAIEDGEEASEVQRQLRRSYSHIVEEFIVGLDKDTDKVQCKKRDVWEGILLKLISPTKEERDGITKMKDDELARKLFKVQQDKKCLIILDDIWSNEAWDILSPAFPSQNTRCKIVFTSHNKDISLHVDPEGLLHEPKSTVSDEFIRLGREMVAKCAGLPLTIIVLGGLLATKERVSDWDTIGGEVREKQKLDEVLDLINSLKTEIPRTKLIQLWVAEGVVSLQYETKWDEAMEDVAECYLGNLISRCMVQVGQMGSTENFLYIINGSQQNSTIDVSSSSNLSDARRIDEVRRLAVFLDQHADQLIPQDKQVNEHLRSLVFFNDKKDPVKGVFVKFKLFQVLDLEGIKGVKGQSLPKEVGNLLWLKFLSLKRTRIQILPSSLGNLDNLQFLNLQTVNKVTVEIPNVICKLKRLRHLYLPNWCGNATNNLQLENLANLQTIVNFLACKCDVKDLLKLKKLRKLVLKDPRHFQKFSESFSPPNKRLDCLLSLSLRTDMLSFPENVVDVEKLVLGCPSLRKLQVEGWMERLPAASLFPPQLSKLTLWGCRLVQDPLLTLEKLLNLKFLNGWDMFVGKKMACSPNGFPQLKVLVLRGLPNLDQWTIEDQAMPNLYRLSISDCNNLKTVPDGLKFITSLRELEIRWMPKSFKTRLGTAGEDYHKVQHVPSIVFLN
uniref:NB-ARC domain-containing protein n=1 Tax=Glycine max TaxID=3847 RepID=A0A0R0IWZ0_SOYBN